MNEVNGSEKDIVRRMGTKFNKELEYIKKKIKERIGKDISNGKITDIILTHDNWEEIREDLIFNYEFNKK